MAEHKLQFRTTIERSPEEVIDFVSDVRNRARYQQALTSISDVQGEAGAGQRWRWTWEMLGLRLEGTGEAVECEAGRSYAFVTEGGVVSRFSYRTEANGDAADVTVEVEFDLPAELSERVDGEQLMAAAKQKGDEALAQLKAHLEQ